LGCSTDLSAPVDVYSEWVDAAGKRKHIRSSHGGSFEAHILIILSDAVAKENEVHTSKPGGSSQPGGARRAAPSRPVEDDDDDDRGYGGDGVVDDDDDDLDDGY
jgi:hypothetical protein